MTCAADKYFPSLTDEQRRRLSMLPELYALWNNKVNVISRKDIGNFETHHLLHSLAIARFTGFITGTKVIDVGTGGGLPGIPLAIIFPHVQFTLIDSIAKKILVVKEITDALGIQNVTAVAARSENFRGQFDFIVSRAVTEMSSFISLTHHLISPLSFNSLQNGYIFLKGGNLADELRQFSAEATVREIRDWFDEPYFETKKIIYLPVKAKK
ncbi:MAG: 16S rRNA (guanine(527)-N(7))-methyltransferase RsmG [Bacteroidales bacterium]|nr:16S rRNA (guanine(527)-N(7))-methyltransferase RsmG [Bacteroidales bacterium]